MHGWKRQERKYVCFSCNRGELTPEADVLFGSKLLAWPKLGSWRRQFKPRAVISAYICVDFGKSEAEKAHRILGG